MERRSLSRTRLAGLGAAAALALTAGTGTAQAADGDWHHVGDGMTSGISGIATDGTHHGRDGTLHGVVVRDNKKPGENRIARIAARPGEKPRLTPLSWKGPLPTDLEAIDRVPGAPGQYVALASAGTGYRIQVAHRSARVLDTFELPGKAGGDGNPDTPDNTDKPNKPDNYESFALARPAASSPPGEDGALIAVWADRGDDGRPSTLRAASFSLPDDEAPARTGGSRTDRAHPAGEGVTFGEVHTARVRAPYPAGDPRSASDLKITGSGELLVGSATDPGDDGPFDSGVYSAGHVALDGAHTGRIEAAEHPEVLERFPGHKVEALTCLPGSDKAVVGTDDENAGSSVKTVTGLCAR